MYSTYMCSRAIFAKEKLSVEHRNPASKIISRWPKPLPRNGSAQNPVNAHGIFLNASMQCNRNHGVVETPKDARRAELLLPVVRATAR